MFIYQRRRDTSARRLERLVAVANVPALLPRAEASKATGDPTVPHLRDPIVRRRSRVNIKRASREGVLE